MQVAVEKQRDETTAPMPPGRPRPLSAATVLTDYTDQTTDQAIEVDPDNRSLSSAEFDAETQSLTPSVQEAIHKYGRTYHSFKAGAYPFPNDPPEAARLAVQHVLFKVLFNNRNYFAPIRTLPMKRPSRILDIGCGLGLWCRQMAQEFPRARVEGTDLSASMDTRLVSEGCHFFVDDIRAREWWRPADKPYDYIHTRLLLGIFPDFREIIQKAYNNLEPGGWMESQEIDSKVYCDDGTMPPDWPFLEWSLKQNEAAMYLGTPLRIANKLKKWYEQAGFVDVKEEIFRIPINQWAKEDRLKMFGKFMAKNMQDGLYGFSVDYFVRAWQYKPEQVHVECANVSKSLLSKTIHAYYKVYVVYGRRPRIGEAPSAEPKPDDWPTEFNSTNDDYDQH